LPLTVPYDGIPELVDALLLRGVRLAVVTNKPEPTAKKLIEHFFPNKFSLVIGGREGAVLKPDPADTLYAIKTLGYSREEAVFVGDTSVDILTGKNAGVALSVGVAWGFREKAELVDAGADIIINEASELLREVDGYEN
jgi:phosphoglycolate phosphatase